MGKNELSDDLVNSLESCLYALDEHLDILYKARFEDNPLLVGAVNVGQVLLNDAQEKIRQISEGLTETLGEVEVRRDRHSKKVIGVQFYPNEKVAGYIKNPDFQDGMRLDITLPEDPCFVNPSASEDVSEDGIEYPERDWQYV